MTRPWWYRTPPIAVVLIAYAATACILFLTVSKSAIVWAGGGLLLGLLTTFVQGAAKARHDRLRSAG
ncbi:hypothetical protein GA0115234_1016202 [Streptomyces sp. DvalAA-43]|nr:hypothetical protein GA0115234_1016202 [Streptomyces sp. DvalAA-43]